MQGGNNYLLCPFTHSLQQGEVSLTKLQSPQFNWQLVVERFKASKSFNHLWTRISTAIVNLAPNQVDCLLPPPGTRPMRSPPQNICGICPPITQAQHVRQPLCQPTNQESFTLLPHPTSPSVRTPTTSLLAPARRHGLDRCSTLGDLLMWSPPHNCPERSCCKKPSLTWALT